MKTVLVIYHTQSGHTGQLAEAVAEGVKQEPEIELRQLKAFDATLEDLLACDALLMGTPENFGYMSGAVKDFLDRTYYPAQEHELNLPYALFVSAGNGRQRRSAGNRSHYAGLSNEKSVGAGDCTR